MASASTVASPLVADIRTSSSTMPRIGISGRPSSITARPAPRQRIRVSTMSRNCGVPSLTGIAGRESDVAGVGHVGRRLAAVVHVEADGVGRDVLHLHVADPDLLDHAAAAARRLEAEPDVGAEERAPLDEDVADAARHLAAHREPAVAVVDDVVDDDDVLGRPPALAAVLVLPRLDADRIVAHVEPAVVDDRAPARIEVEAVAVLRVPRVQHRDVPDDDVLGEQRVDVPRRRVLERRAVEQHAAALDERDHDRPQELARGGVVLEGRARPRSRAP